MAQRTLPRSLVDQGRSITGSSLRSTVMTSNLRRIAVLVTALVGLGALMFAVVQPASAATTVRATYGPLGAVAQGPSGAGSADFTAVAAGGSVVLTPQRVVTEDAFQWLVLGLPWDHRDITSVRVCYKVTAATAAATYISQTRLSDTTVPPSANVRLDEGTNRTSTAGACYTVPTGFVPAGAVTLELKVVFGSTADRIQLGAVQLSGKA
jgi:hypothetical protein